MDKSQETWFLPDDVIDFMTHLHFDHCGGSVQWNRIKQAMNPLSRTAKFWSNESHWNGQQNQIQEGFFCLKIFCRCKKAGNLILSKDLVTI
jgi:hypothetical protein